MKNYFVSFSYGDKVLGWGFGNMDFLLDRSMDRDLLLEISDVIKKNTNTSQVTILYFKEYEQ